MADSTSENQTTAASKHIDRPKIIVADDEPMARLDLRMPRADGGTLFLDEIGEDDITFDDVLEAVC